MCSEIDTLQTRPISLVSAEHLYTLVSYKNTKTKSSTKAETIQNLFLEIIYNGLSIHAHFSFKSEKNWNFIPMFRNDWEWKQLFNMVKSETRKSSRALDDIFTWIKNKSDWKKMLISKKQQKIKMCSLVEKDNQESDSNTRASGAHRRILPPFPLSPRPTSPLSLGCLTVAQAGLELTDVVRFLMDYLRLPTSFGDRRHVPSRQASQEEFERWPTLVLGSSFCTFPGCTFRIQDVLTSTKTLEILTSYSNLIILY